ncbi:hypothetical protein [Halarcobacter sp.]|uniref:hypothetical protein n=1 Tax=Halarcobacter sp. TaxID=2321133 RepID=UPI0029F58C53|nr:hypothetical protein [Halarcobacter sp.]
MKKSFILSVLIISLFGGCFSFSSLNPFSDSKDDENRVKIEIPDEAPIWLKEQKEKNNIVALGATKNVNQEQPKLSKQKALISAGHNLSRKVYIKTMKILKNYLEKVPSKVFEKDLRKEAEQIALKSLDKAKIIGFWENNKKQLFTLIKLDTSTLAEDIQLSSKKLFNVDYHLYENILSNRAKAQIMRQLEE